MAIEPHRSHFQGKKRWGSQRLCSVRRGLRRCRHEDRTRVHARHVGGVVEVAARVDAPRATGLRCRVAGGVGLECLAESVRFDLMVACTTSHDKCGSSTSIAHGRLAASCGVSE